MGEIPKPTDADRARDLAADYERAVECNRQLGYVEGKLYFAALRRCTDAERERDSLAATLAACQEQLKHAHAETARALDTRDVTDRENTALRRTVAEQASLLREGDRAYACSEPEDFWKG